MRWRDSRGPLGSWALRAGGGGVGRTLPAFSRPQFPWPGWAGGARGNPSPVRPDRRGGLGHFNLVLGDLQGQASGAPVSPLPAPGVPASSHCPLTPPAWHSWALESSHTLLSRPAAEGGRGRAPRVPVPTGWGREAGTMASFFSLGGRGWGTPGCVWGAPPTEGGAMLSHPTWPGPCFPTPLHPCPGSTPPPSPPRPRAWPIPWGPHKRARPPSGGAQLTW